MATEAQLQFIKRIGTAARSDMQSSGVLASLTIAQAIQESGWGTSTLATMANALFGIKASNGWSGATYTVNTQEYLNGSYVTVSSAFRAYNSWEDSIKGHSDFLLANSRYE